MNLVDPATGEIDCTLSSDEAEVLASAEIVIERGLTSFYDVGDALAEINERRLYRATHRTFIDYCQDRWKITDRRARQLIQAAATIDSLEIGTIVPTNEAQARSLAKVPAEHRDAVMTKVAEEADPTAAAIDRTWAEMQQPEIEPEAPAQTPPSAPAPVPAQQEVPAPSAGPTPPTPRLPKSAHAKAFNAVTTADNALTRFLALDVDDFQSFDDAEWEVVQYLVRRAGDVAGRVAEAGRRRRRLTSIAGGK